MNTQPTTTAPANPYRSAEAAYTATQQALIDALAQLNQSERGRRALAAFRQFLEADERSACGLDSENLAAIVTLADSCRLFGAYTVLQILQPKPRRK